MRFAINWRGYRLWTSIPGLLSLLKLSIVQTPKMPPAICRIGNPTEAAAAAGPAMNKERSAKRIHTCIYKDGSLWNVQYGQLKRRQGRPGKIEHLFRVVGEKLPYAALGAVKAHVRENGFGTNGVYVAHDSMGFPRYIGRGSIFARLQARRKAQALKL